MKARAAFVYVSDVSRAETQYQEQTEEPTRQELRAVEEGYPVGQGRSCVSVF